MSSAESRHPRAAAPGRRRAESARRGRRREEPAREVARPPRPRRPRRDWHALGRGLWLCFFVVAVSGLVVDRAAHPFARLGESAAALLLTLLAAGLAARTGARLLLPTLCAAGVGVAAITLDWAPIHAGAAVASGVLGAVAAVLATEPAATFGRAAREVVVALLVAGAASLGVAGFGARVGVVRFGYVVLALALLLAMALVYRLGAGLHGVGRRGYLLAGTAVVLLAIALAYSAALARWGSPDLIDTVTRFRGEFRTTLHAVPHPIEVLLGIPALVWGVFMRARRRQGWWVCAFGVAATASVTTHLIDPGVALHTTLLSAAYSLVLGLVLGYVVIRVEQSLSGTHGRRARRGEEALAHRPEPGRLHALL